MHLILAVLFYYPSSAEHETSFDIINPNAVLWKPQKFKKPKNPPHPISFFLFQKQHKIVLLSYFCNIRNTAFNQNVLFSDVSECKGAGHTYTQTQRQTSQFIDSTGQEAGGVKIKTSLHIGF